MQYYWFQILKFFRTVPQQIKFWLGERDKLLIENAELKKTLSNIDDKNLESYVNANTFLSTATGLELQFRGKELVKIIAACFWELVQEADNFIICDVNNHLGECIKVIITKPGKLTPTEKLKTQEDEIKELKKILGII